MSNKTYTAAEVEAMLAEQKARLESRNGGGKFTITRETRLRKDKTPYTGIWLSGTCKPTYISDANAKLLVESFEVLKSAVSGPAVDKTKAEPVEETPALSSNTAPRIAAKS